MSKGTRIKQAGKPVDDPVTMFLNGRTYSGWENLSIDKSLTALSGAFQMSLVDRWKPDQKPWIVKPGQEIHIHFGKDQIMTGFIDSLDAASSAGSRTIAISGRDRTGDLVDCSIISATGEYKNLSLEQLAVEFVKPFFNGRLKVFNYSGDTEKFSTFAVKQGETVFEALGRGAKLRGVLITTDGFGNLIILKKGQTTASSDLVSGENIKSSSASYDFTERFSKYIVKGQSKGSESFNSESATAIKAESTDEGISRYRPTIIIGEGGMTQASAQKRANWEATFRAAEAVKASVTVQGWRQGNGSLWQLNQLIRVTDGNIGLKRQKMLVESLNFSKSAGGTLTTFGLVRPDAFDLQKNLKKEKDPTNDMGW